MSQKNTILSTNVGSGSSGVKQRSPLPPTRSFSGGGMRKNPPPSPFSGGRLPHRQSSAIVLPTSSKLSSSLKLSSSSTITNHVSNVNANANANTNNFHTNTIAPSPSSTKSTPMIIPSSRRRTPSHQSFQPPLTPQQYHPRVQHHSSQKQQKSASSTSQLSFSDWLLYVCFTKRRFIPLLQMILALSVTAMVLQSRYQASYATQQLQSFQIEEGKLLLQLKKLERQSLRLHDNIRRRLVKATATTNNDENEKDAHQQQQQQQQQSNNDNNSKNKGKPGNKKEELSLEAQTSELIQMTQELDAQVATLQGHIQASARQQIVQHYGEGAIKVVWELEFWNKDFTKKNKKKRANTVSILLWPDTPHAAWTWLEQISRGVWDNASFHLSDREPLSLRATPIHPDPLHKGQLEFVEDDSSPHTPDEKNNNPHWHKAWTVGLREASYTYYNDPLASSSENNNNNNNKKDNNESDPKPITRIRSGKDAASMRREIENNEKQNKPGDDDMDNRLAIFVNLQDNSKYHALGSNEPCIGRIIDGYDTLQRLMLEASQTTQGDVPSSIWISKTTVMHMTRRELDML